MPRLLGVSDIARELDRPIQVVSNWYRRGSQKLPPPSYLGPNDAPLWTRQALEKAETLPPLIPGR